MIKTERSGLECIEICQNDPNHKNKKAFIVMHGFGANYEDLVGLYHELNLTNIDWYFLNGPVTVQVSPYWTGRAWFNLNWARMNELYQKGSLQEYFNEKNPEFFSSLDSVSSIVQDLSSNYSDVYVGGFSQGAMMASHVAFNRPEIIKKLVMLSGAKVGGHILDDLNAKMNTVPFQTFQTHGMQDPVLPYNDALIMKDFLDKYNSKHQFVSFQGGHEIPPIAISQLKQFLQSV